MINTLNTHCNKEYVVYSLLGDTELFQGHYGDKYLDSDSILQRLAKDLGFTYDLYTTLLSISLPAATSLVNSMSKQSNHTEITLLVDEEKVLGYSLEAPRTPVLNNEFVDRTLSLVETSDSVEVSEVYYHPEDTISSIIIKKVKPITIEEKYEGKDSKFIDYDIGILLVNDELSTTYSRLVMYIDGHPLYLPASYYNSTISRYKRSTGSSIEALEVLILKIIDDLREDELLNKIQDLHYRYRANKSILATYEEYNTVMKTMSRIPTIIDDKSYMESLVSKCENFERKYVKMDSQKSSYIWRCTATSNTSIYDLISITISILKDMCAPPIEYANIRELLGSYISTDRIATEIAME